MHYPKKVPKSNIRLFYNFFKDFICLNSYKIKWHINSGCFLRPLFRKFWKVKKINLGEVNSDFARWGWETISLNDADFCVDLKSKEKLPLKNNSVKILVSCHLIEHLTDEENTFLFEELHRILCFNGVLRLACPDIDAAYKAYMEKDTSFFCAMLGARVPLVKSSKFPRESLQLHNLLINVFSCNSLGGGPPICVSIEEFEKQFNTLSKLEFISWCTSLLLDKKESFGHKNGFNFSKIKTMLTKAGFNEVVRKNFRESNIPDFRSNDFEKDKHSLPGKGNSTLLIIEAKKS